MARRSQCSSAGDNPLDPNYLPPHYREDYRLAIDALIEEDLDGYYQFLQKADVVDFLSAPEIEYIQSSVQVPQQSFNLEQHFVESEGDGSSDTYWPIHSDLDAPGLDLGWPHLHHFIGPTEVTTLVNPAEPDMPSIKEQARRLIKNAQQVVAIVMDMFTDVDMFADILDAAMRNVAVYILLDKQNAHHFVNMVSNCRVNLQSIQMLRVRTVSGITYHCRTGKSFNGQMLDRFLLTDCRAVLSGNYSFMWSFEKIHRCMAHLFLGQLVSTFDEEFRILFAQSHPLIVENYAPPVEEFGVVQKRPYLSERALYREPKKFNPLDAARPEEWPRHSYDDRTDVDWRHMAMKKQEAMQGPVDIYGRLTSQHQPRMDPSFDPGPSRLPMMENLAFKRHSYAEGGRYPYPFMQQGTPEPENQGGQFHRGQQPGPGPGPEYSGYDKFWNQDFYSADQCSESGQEMDPLDNFDPVLNYLSSTRNVDFDQSSEKSQPAPDLPIGSPHLKRMNLGQPHPCQTSPTSSNPTDQKSLLQEPNADRKDPMVKRGLRNWRISSYLSAYDNSGEEDMPSSPLNAPDPFEEPSNPTPGIDLSVPKIPNVREFKVPAIPRPSHIPNYAKMTAREQPKKLADEATAAEEPKTTPTPSESSSSTEVEKIEEAEQKEQKEPKSSVLRRDDSFRRNYNAAVQRSSRLRSSLIFSSLEQQHAPQDTKPTLEQHKESDKDEAEHTKLPFVSQVLGQRRSTAREPYEWSRYMKSATFDNSTTDQSKADEGNDKQDDKDSAKNTNVKDTSEEKESVNASNKEQSKPPEAMQPKTDQPAQLPKSLLTSPAYVDMNDPDNRLMFFKELAAKRKAAKAAEAAKSKEKVKPASELKDDATVKKEEVGPKETSENIADTPKCEDLLDKKAGAKDAGKTLSTEALSHKNNKLDSRVETDPDTSQSLKPEQSRADSEQAELNNSQSAASLPVSAEIPPRKTPEEPKLSSPAAPTQTHPVPASTAPASAPPVSAPPASAPPASAPPASAPPASATPASAPPASAPPVSAPPASAPPASAPPASAPPASATPASAPPASAPPASATPASAPPASATPASASPTSSPTSSPPASAPPTSAAPASAPPTSAPPTSAPPANATPASAHPTSAPPANAHPTSSPPTSSPPASAPPASAPPTSAAPTISPPISATPASAPPTSAPPTSAPPANATPANAPPTSAPPTSAPANAPPASVPPTSALPANAPPAISTPASAPPANATLASAPPATAPPAHASPASAPPSSAPSATALPARAAPALAAPTSATTASAPPATAPSAHASPASAPPDTAPPSIAPSATVLPAHAAPTSATTASASPATVPPATAPPASAPPATTPPATEPPATAPPASAPPATTPPATEPPASASPASDILASAAPAIPASASPAPAILASAAPSAAPASAAPAPAIPASAAPASASPTSAIPASASPTSAIPASAALTSAIPASAALTSAIPASAAPASALSLAQETDESKKVSVEVQPSPNTQNPESVQSQTSVPSILLPEQHPGADHILPNSGSQVNPSPSPFSCAPKDTHEDSSSSTISSNAQETLLPSSPEPSQVTSSETPSAAETSAHVESNKSTAGSTPDLSQSSTKEACAPTPSEKTDPEPESKYVPSKKESTSEPLSQISDLASVSAHNQTTSPTPSPEETPPKHSATSSPVHPALNSSETQATTPSQLNLTGSVTSTEKVSCSSPQTESVGSVLSPEAEKTSTAPERHLDSLPKQNVATSTLPAAEMSSPPELTSEVQPEPDLPCKTPESVSSETQPSEKAVPAETSQVESQNEVRKDPEKDHSEKKADAPEVTNEVNKTTTQEPFNDEKTNKQVEQNNCTEPPSDEAIPPSMQSKQPKSNQTSRYQSSTANVLSSSNLRDDTKLLLEQISANNQSRNETAKESPVTDDEKEDEADKKAKMVKERGVESVNRGQQKTNDEREKLLEKIQSMRKERKVYSRFEMAPY